MANKHNDARWQIALPDIPARVNPSRPLALLVDDNPDVLVGIGAYLEAAGFEIVRVPNGDEAVAHLASGQMFDLLVTDYAMPGLNGVDLAKCARDRHPTLKVLIITGYPSDAGLFDRPACVALLAKPFRRAKLIEVLHTLFPVQPVSPASPN